MAPTPAFLSPFPAARMRTSSRRVSLRQRTTCQASPLPQPTPARGENARRLAKWLSADWDNRPQAMENPQFWSHIHVCFRPLPWELLNGYALYCESAYDYNLGAPYKTSVVLVVPTQDGKHLELASYKLADADEYWLGAHEPSLLEGLTADQLLPMEEACNTVYEYDEERGVYTAFVRPGKGCVIRRGGVERETYLDSTIELTAETYSAWDLGRDLDTDERVWGTPAGPFLFTPASRLDHLVPEEPASVAGLV